MISLKNSELLRKMPAGKGAILAYIEELDSKINGIKEVVERGKKSIKEVEQIKKIALDKLSKDPIELQISDHAIMRYAERVLKIFSRHLIAQEIKNKLGQVVEDGEYRLDKDTVFIIKNKTLVTFI